MLEAWWKETVSGERSDLGSALARGALAALAVPYWLGLKANLSVYTSGLMPRRRARLPVVSIGNLTLGGTGKSTAVKFLAGRLQEADVPVGIVLRGYGRRGRQKVALVDKAAEVSEVGDEAAMLARALPDCPVGVGKRRELAIAAVAEETDARVALLDDGFQYFRLSKLADIVLIDALADTPRQRLFPAGHLREPPSHLQRATQVWLTHCDQASGEQLAEAREFVARWASEVLVVTTRHRNTSLRLLNNEVGQTELNVAGQTAVALSGIGNPAPFEANVASLGAARVVPCRFADHHFFTAQDMTAVAELAKRHAADLVITTEKDAIRIAEAPADLKLMVLGCELEILSGQEHITELIEVIAEQ